MFTGSLIMCPVAYDARSTGISGGTFAKPIPRTPPCASSSWLGRWPRPPRGPPALGRADERGAAEPGQVVQVAEVLLPVPVAERELAGQAHRVVVGREELLDDRGQLLRLLHQTATAVAGIGTSIGWATGGPACGKAITAQARLVSKVSPISKVSTTSAASASAAPRSPSTSATIVPLRRIETIAGPAVVRLMWSRTRAVRWRIACTPNSSCRRVEAGGWETRGVCLAL